MKYQQASSKASALMVGLIFSFSLLTGCATTTTVSITNPEDPYENMNRKVFNFNKKLDKWILRPIAKAYDTMLPDVVLKGVSNFFGNVDDVSTLMNDILQFKLYQAVSDAWRIGFNTTVGVFGLFDVGTAVGLEKHYEDFGLTLARWGYKNSNYMVIPLFGPSTFRDAMSRPVTFYALSVYPFIESPYLRYGVYSFEVLDDRRELLGADSAIDEALDPYVFVRDAYLQNRKSKMAGGSANAVEDIYLEENQPAKNPA